MLAILIGASCVGRVKTVPLMTHCDHVLLIYNLVGIFVARGSYNAHPVLFHIEYEIVLTHKGASH